MVTMTARYFPLFVFFLALQLSASASFAWQDWNQWRGPELDSVAGDQSIVSELSESTRLWRTKLKGPAGASPIVIGDRIFVTSAGKKLLVECFEVATGKQLWSKPVAGKNEKGKDSSNSASNSPCSDGTHLWTTFGNGQVSCFTLDGKEVWTKNLQEQYGNFEIMFGMTTTPLLVDGQLIYALMGGKMRDPATSVGTVISLDAATGDEKWAHVRKTDAKKECKHVYASPTIAELDGKKMLIVHGADYTTAHELDGGKEVWRLGGMNPKNKSYNPTLRFVSSPVSADDLVVIPSAKRGPVWAVKIDSKGTLTRKDLVWFSERVTPDVASPVIYNDRVFLAREKGTLVCLDAGSGKKLIEKRYLADKHRSTPVAVDGKLVIVDRSGKLMLIEADEKLKEIAAIELGEETTASPAVADGIIFVRTFEALYAFGKPVDATTPTGIVE